MTFWITAFALAALSVVIVLRPMLRAGGQRPDDGGTELALYKAQLAEVDRDLARGVLDPSEAELTRTEIARRILSAERGTAAPAAVAPHQATTAVAVVSGLLLVAGAGTAYLSLGAPGYPDLPLQTRIAMGDQMRESRPSQAEFEAQLPAPALPTEADGFPQDYLDMVAQLRAAVPGRPDDLEGWTLLARHEAQLGQYAAAARAQARVVELKGFDATEDDLVTQADLMVAATQGFVSPEAEEVVTRIRLVNPDNPAVWYYTGLLYAQTDRPDLAFRLWREVVDKADPASLHARLARSQIEDVAARAGVNYTLPEPALRGPTAEDMAAMAALDPEAQRQMIEGMVAGLMDRLATEGGTAAEWAQLIRALVVLGRTDQAEAIFTEAQTVFAADPDALAAIAEAVQAGALSGQPDAQPAPGTGTTPDNPETDPAADAAAPDGDMPDGDTPDGDTPDGDMPDDAPPAPQPAP